MLLTSLHRYAGLFKHSLFAYAVSTKIPWTVQISCQPDSQIMLQIMWKCEVYYSNNSSSIKSRDLLRFTYHNSTYEYITKGKSSFTRSNMNKKSHML